MGFRDLLRIPVVVSTTTTTESEVVSGGGPSEFPPRADQPPPDTPPMMDEEAVVRGRGRSGGGGRKREETTATATVRATETETNTSYTHVYLTPQNLTFPGVTVIGGFILSFIAKAFHLDSFGQLWVAAGLAAIFGIVIMTVGLTDALNTEKKPVQIFVGLVNMVLLWISLYSVSTLSIGT